MISAVSQRRGYTDRCILILSLNNAIKQSHHDGPVYDVRMLGVFITASPYDYMNCRETSYKVTRRLLNHIEFPFLLFRAGWSNRLHGFLHAIL